MNIGDYQELCSTTSTPRYYNPMCKCATYPENLGPCKTWEEGGNGSCVYCDHTQDWHLILSGMTHGEPDYENVDRGINYPPKER